MRRLIVAGAVVIAAVVVGLLTDWPFGLGILLVAALGFSVMRVLGVEQEATTRWSSALYGNDADDADHWSKTGGKRTR